MKRGLAYNKGINDVPNMSGTKVYMVWYDMIRRCYSELYQEKHPTYKNCIIDESFIKLSDFIPWFTSTYIENYQIDKDIYIPGNKVYSPNSCIFVPRYVNMLIVNIDNNSGIKKQYNKYSATCREYGKRVYLGLFDTKEEAKEVYITRKTKHFIEIADTFWVENEKIAIGLYRHTENLLGNNWEETLPLFDD